MTNTTERIEQLLDTNSVFLFMKRNPQTPMCGFSSNTVKILKDLIGEEEISVTEEIIASISAMSSMVYVEQGFDGYNDEVMF